MHAKGTIEINGISYTWKVSPADESKPITAGEIARAAEMAATKLLNDERIHRKTEKHAA